MPALGLSTEVHVLHPPPAGGGFSRINDAERERQDAEHKEKRKQSRTTSKKGLNRWTPGSREKRGSCRTAATWPASRTARLAGQGGTGRRITSALAPAPSLFLSPALPRNHFSGSAFSRLTDWRLDRRRAER